MKVEPTFSTIDQRRCEELNGDKFLYINGYNMQRIVYELIKNYMMSNTPEECGIALAQKYDPDPTKSQIKLDVAFNWKTQDMDKVPAIYVQRGDVDFNSPLLGQTAAGGNVKESEDSKMVICRMPVQVSCVAAEPVAVVENLAEYVKQALLCFKREVKLDFRLREFQLKKITKPERTKESKNNFVVDLVVDTAFDENWIVKREGLKLKTVGLALFDGITQQCNTCGG